MPCFMYTFVSLIALFWEIIYSLPLWFILACLRNYVFYKQIA